MKIIYQIHISNCALFNRVVVLAFLHLPLVIFAQQKSIGNTHIFGGGQMTLLNKHFFANGGNGTLPGIISTERIAPFGILNFASNISYESVGDNAYVDGYVRKFGTSHFIFPVGDNGFFGPFAASGDGTYGAYFHTNPSSAITSHPEGGNNPVLPAGGPFSTSSKEEFIDKISQIEYWDIDGKNATRVTLTWDSGSGIDVLTSSQLNKLTIVGWNGTKWIKIPCSVDNTALLGGVSNLSSGSITSMETLIPDNFCAYTLAAITSPLPVTLTSFTVKAELHTALLKWTTIAETNSDRFQIERSIDGKNWLMIGIVAAMNESNLQSNYFYQDINPMNGENLYRLKMIDQDEAFAFSSIQSTIFLSENDNLIVYPNPVVDKLKIQNTFFTKNRKQIRNVKITDVNGQVNNSFKIINGEIDVQQLNNGVYILSTTNESGIIFHFRFVISK